MIKSILYYIEHRFNVVALSVVVLIAAGLLITSGFSDKSFSDFASDNALMIVGLIVMTTIPIFIGATQSTLRSDLLDREILKDYQKEFSSFKNYKHDAMTNALYRLYLEAGDQKSYAAKNLAIGMGLTTIAIFIAIVLLFESRASSISQTSLMDYLYKLILPRIAIVFFIQLVGAFFLRWYSKNVQNLETISNKMLFLELVLASSNGKNTPDKILGNFDISKLYRATKQEERLYRTLLKQVAGNTSLNITNKE